MSLSELHSLMFTVTCEASDEILIFGLGEIDA